MSLRSTALLIAKSAYNGADPFVKVLESLTEFSPLIDSYSDHLVIASGKAAGRMMEGYMKYVSSCSNKQSLNVRGRLVTNHGGYIPQNLPNKFRSSTASHPTPDKSGEEAALDILNLASSVTKDTLCLVLLSGGTSALLPSPSAPLSLEDLISLNTSLLSCGASIDEINCLRKHTSSISGGRLMKRLTESGVGHVITLAMSDVVGDRADVIASGPMSADPSTFSDAFDIISKYKLHKTLSSKILDHIISGTKGLVQESEKSVPLNCEYKVVGRNRSALEEVAAELLKHEKLKCHILTSTLQGEAQDVAKVLAAFLHGRLVKEDEGSDLSRPCALLFGGETTVTLGAKHGVGGRAQELALAVAVSLESLLGPSDHHSHKWECIAVGSDGLDGPSTAAGAFVNEKTVTTSRKIGLDANAYLRTHDCHTFFSSLSESGDEGGLIVTGPSGTNVADVYVLIAR